MTEETVLYTLDHPDVQAVKARYDSNNRTQISYDALWGYFTEGKSYNQIAKLTGISKQAIGIKYQEYFEMFLGPKLNAEAKLSGIEATKARRLQKERIRKQDREERIRKRAVGGIEFAVLRAWAGKNRLVEPIVDLNRNTRFDARHPVYMVGEQRVVTHRLTRFFRPRKDHGPRYISIWPMLSLLEDVEQYVYIIDIPGDPYVHVYDIPAEEMRAAAQKSTTKKFQFYEPYGHEGVPEDSTDRLRITKYKRSIPRDALEDLISHSDACAA